MRQKIKSADDKKAALNTRTKVKTIVIKVFDQSPLILPKTINLIQYQPPKPGAKKRIPSNSRIPSGPRNDNTRDEMKRTTVLGNSPSVNRYANGQIYDEDVRV